MEPSTVWHALMRPPWRFLFSVWPWRALVYLLVSAALGVLLVPVTILTLLLLPLWGIVIGALERRRSRILGFARQASGHVLLAREQRHIWLAVRVNERATWRETAALLLDLVLGLIMLATSQKEKAAQAFENALKLRPDYEDAKKNLLEAKD